jgi:predicted metal-dependent hydrolase
MKKSWKSSKNQTKEIRLKNFDIQYSVEHREVKYPRLEFKSNYQLLIILPPDISDEQDLLNKKEEWITMKITEINRYMKQAKEYQKMMGDKDFIFGNPYNVKYSKGKFNVNMDNKELEVISPAKKYHKPFLKNWLKRELKERITYHLKDYSNKLGVSYNRVFIRSQKTKWGSCSSEGNLNFNLKLAALPEDLIEYVVLHELTHIIEDNHNNNFWKIVEKYYPDYKEKESLLDGFWFFVDNDNFWKKIT